MIEYLHFECSIDNESRRERPRRGLIRNNNGIYCPDCRKFFTFPNAVFIQWKKFGLKRNYRVVYVPLNEPHTQEWVHCAVRQIWI